MAVGVIVGVPSGEGGNVADGVGVSVAVGEGACVDVAVGRAGIKVGVSVGGSSGVLEGAN